MTPQQLIDLAATLFYAEQAQALLMVGEGVPAVVQAAEFSRKAVRQLAKVIDSLPADEMLAVYNQSESLRRYGRVEDGTPS